MGYITTNLTSTGSDAPDFMVAIKSMSRHSFKWSGISCTPCNEQHFFAPSYAPNKGSLVCPIHFRAQRVFFFGGSKFPYQVVGLFEIARFLEKGRISEGFRTEKKGGFKKWKTPSLTSTRYHFVEMVANLLDDKTWKLRTFWEMFTTDCNIANQH